MMNQTSTRRNFRFFKDVIPVALGLTIAMAALDLFVKWLGKFANYNKHQYLTPADGTDIAIASVFIFTSLAFVITLKHRFPLSHNQLISPPNVIRNAAFSIIPTGISFGLDTLLKYVTDIYGEKKYTAQITSHEWRDIGATSSLVLLSLIIALVIKDTRRTCQCRTTEENPNHIVYPQQVTENTTINNSLSTNYSTL